MLTIVGKIAYGIVYGLAAVWVNLTDEDFGIGRNLQAILLILLGTAIFIFVVPAVLYFLIVVLRHLIY